MLFSLIVTFGWSFMYSSYRPALSKSMVPNVPTVTVVGLVVPQGPPLVLAAASSELPLPQPAGV